MLQLAVVWINAQATKVLVLAWKLKRCSHLLKSKAPYVTQFMPTSWAAIVNPWLASRTYGMTIGALHAQMRQNKIVKESVDKFIFNFLF